jgi:penicillin-binding protein 2
VKLTDTTEFCELLNITKDQFIRSYQEARNYSRYKASTFLSQVSAKTYASFLEKEHKFPGFFAQPRTLRKYARETAAHVLGYVQEVDQNMLRKNKYYEMHDYIGASGIEKYYEEYLRGEKGRKVYMVDVHNKIIGSFEEGQYDEEAKVGKNLQISIDTDLQVYGEKLMDGFKGSIIAIEPKTGEILSFVSSPTFKPGYLVGRERGKHFAELQQDTLDPLYNRGVLAYQYPPGSTFKVINALIGLEEDVVKSYTKYSCNMGYHRGRIKIGCHYHKSPLNFVQAIQNSCNAYFYYVFKNIMEHKDYPDIRASFSNWRNHVLSFGLGQELGIDLPIEEAGLVADTSYYDHYYGKTGWRAVTIRSLAIGQGELGVTPLQLANMACVMANRGYYIPPHFIKEIEGLENIPEKYNKPVFSTIDSVHFPLVIAGMDSAVNGGSGSTARIARLRDVVVCGKTGTAQNPHGEDHSIFIAFAPKDDPQIAISVYVENGGFGSTWAAPIASLMIEKYLIGEIQRRWVENRILKANLLNLNEEEN